MQSPNPHFGVLIAYLLPGFIALGGIALLAPSVGKWLQPQATGSGFGPPVYAVLAAIAVGMIVSCVRWLLIDHLFWLLNVRAPAWDTAQLSERMTAFTYLVESHYRFYQFYANALIAIAWTYLLNRWFATSPMLGIPTDLAMLAIAGTLLAGARDALSKYYGRTRKLLADFNYIQDRGETMTNGCHRDHAAPPTSHRDKAQPNTPKAPAKPVDTEKRKAAPDRK